MKYSSRIFLYQKQSISIIFLIDKINIYLDICNPSHGMHLNLHWYFWIKLELK